MTRAQMPSSVEELVESLSGLDRLVVAKQWEKAAMVWSFTEDRGPGGDQKSDHARHSVHDRLTIREFVRLGIATLRTQDSVRAWRNMWRIAMEQHGAADVKPGDVVELPDAEWPGRQDESGRTRYSARSPEAFAGAISADPDPDRQEVNADLLAQNLSPEAADAVVARLAEDRPEIVSRHAATANSLLFNRVDDDGPRRGLHQARDALRSDNRTKVGALLARIDVLTREVRHLMPEVERDDRADLAAHIRDSADLLRMVGDAYGGVDLDRELEALLKED